MNELINSLRKNLLTSINFNLIAFLGLIYSFRGKKEMECPVELLLIFDAELQIRIKCHSDGESILVDNKQLVETNLGEYGKNGICNLSKLDKASNIMGKKLLDVDLIVSTESIIFGVVLVFENDAKLVVLNLGDELFIYDELPEKILREENAQLKRLN